MNATEATIGPVGATGTILGDTTTELNEATSSGTYSTVGKPIVPDPKMSMRNVDVFYSGKQAIYDVSLDIAQNEIPRGSDRAGRQELAVDRAKIVEVGSFIGHLLAPRLHFL